MGHKTKRLCLKMGETKPDRKFVFPAFAPVNFAFGNFACLHTIPRVITITQSPAKKWGVAIDTALHQSHVSRQRVLNKYQ